MDFEHLFHCFSGRIWLPLELSPTIPLPYPPPPQDSLSDLWDFRAWVWQPCRVRLSPSEDMKNGHEWALFFPSSAPSSLTHGPPAPKFLARRRTSSVRYFLLLFQRLKAGIHSEELLTLKVKVHSNLRYLLAGDFLFISKIPLSLC